MNKPTFSIKAGTFTLKNNTQSQESILLSDFAHFVIPIYQRPYSWDQEQIKKFISDIFTSYSGTDGEEVIEEPIFIGTMQTSPRSSDESYDIIDGQQRLTTFLVLFKILKIRYSESVTLNEIKLNFLKTEVNRGTQEAYLQEMLNSNLVYNDGTINPYLKNAKLIEETFNEHIKDPEGASISFNIDNFVNHILSNIYFVVIETQALLSKTLQIFNAINTTGLDLNGGDVFKIRFYEYLTVLKKNKNNVFDQISSLYEKVDLNNKKHGRPITDIKGILHIYQYFLISKYKLPVILYNYGVDTFFDHLFDTLLGNYRWDHFKNNVIRVDLTIEDIDSLIDIRFDWEDKWKKSEGFTAETKCLFHFISLSRYSRYRILVFLFLKAYPEKEQSDKLFIFIKQLGKLFIIYSVRFQKRKGEIYDGFMHELMNVLIDNSVDKAILLINHKIGNLDNHSKWYDLTHHLSEDLTRNAKRKNIICRLSAMLEEEYQTMVKKDIQHIEEVLFGSNIDIEHIQSYHHKDGTRRQDIWNEWRGDLNSIGNLVVLERSINRSISNNDYKIKVERYADSSFEIVKQHAKKHPKTWSLDECLERKNNETIKLINYLFSN